MYCQRTCGRAGVLAAWIRPETTMRVLPLPCCCTSPYSTAAWPGCRTAEPRDLVAAVDGEAAMEKDRIRHRRVVVLAREPGARESLRTERAGGRAEAMPSGGHQPAVARLAVHQDGHALARLVDLDDEAGVG